MVSMDCVLWLVPVFFSTFTAGLFTVEVDKSMYMSEVRGDVVMGCSFQPPSPAALSGLRVTWHWIAPGAPVREVYRLDNGVEHLTSQHPDYLDRARLLRDELKRGWAKLQVSNLKISDSGKYQCFVQTEDGADYKTLTLSISAPFKTIDKRIEKVPGREDVVLSCRSEGYPQKEVVWQTNGQQLMSKPITTTVKTEDQLFEITTRINVTSRDKKNYTCNFMDHAATFEIPDDIPAAAEKNNAAVIVVVSLVMTLALTILILVLCKYCQIVKAMKNDTINEEEKNKINPTANDVCLKILLRDHYLKWPKNLPRSHSETEETCPTLYNNDGQEVNLHDFVTGRGAALLLEGSTGNTTLARMLVSSWAQESVTSASNFPDLSHLQLVVYVDGRRANGTLFHEIVTQLSLEEVLSEDDLRDVLTDQTLLIVDGYNEGNLPFDKSLQSFLLNPTGCRVLITTSLEDSKIKSIVGTGAIVQVQRQSNRY